MYLLKKPTKLSPSIPRRQLNFKGTKTLKNDVSEFSGSSPSKDYKSSEIAESTGTSDDWTDMEETLIECSTLESSLDQVVVVSSQLHHNIDSDSFESFNYGGPISCSTPKSSFFKDKRESSNDYSPVEHFRFANSFDNFDYGEPSEAPTTYSPKAPFTEDRKGSSSDYSPVEQARFADSFNFNIGAPIAASTPHASLVKDGKDLLPEGAKYRNSFEGSFEKESFKNSCGTQKLPESSFVEDKRNFSDINFGAPIAASPPCSPNPSLVKDGKEILPEGAVYWNSFERSFDKGSAKSSRATQKQPESSSVKDKKKILPEGTEYWNSFERSFEKESAKSSRATQKQLESSSVKDKRKLYRSSFRRSFEKELSESCCDTEKVIYPEKIPKRRPKLKKRKLQYSGYLLSDKKPENSKDTSKQLPEIEPIKKDLSRCEENICPIGRDLVPYRKKSLPPPFFGGDVPIDDIYFLINGSKLKTKKIRAKRFRENKSKEKWI